MYINTLKITLSDIFDINQTEYSISWMLKADIVEVINQYIKNKKLTEIVNIDNGYSITWNSKEGYKEFVGEDLYLNLVNQLEDLGVSISWLE
jgi:hypothetical protein